MSPLLMAFVCESLALPLAQRVAEEKELNLRQSDLSAESPGCREQEC